MATAFKSWRQGPAPVLPPFTREPPPLTRLMRRTIFIALCVFLGIFYGFSMAVFPPFFLIYLGIPILLLAVVVIWALPDQGRAPVGLLRAMLTVYVVGVVLWPIYLSIALPGLPWISLRRLVAFPMMFVFLICLSISGDFRRRMAEVVRASGFLGKAVILFVCVQYATLVISPYLAASINYLINYTFLCSGVFFLSAWAFSQDGAPERLVRLLVGSAAVLVVIAALEWRMEQIIWANHIPWFFQIDDPNVRQMLSSEFREGVYRVTGPFTTSLSLAEYMAIASVFVLHFMLNAKSWSGRIVWGAFAFAILLVIFSTRARLGIAGWFAGHAFYAVIWSYRRWVRNKDDIIGPALAIATPIFAAIFLVAMFTVDAVRFRTIGGGSTGLSDDARRQQFDLAWPKLLQNPFGYGPANSGDVIGFRTPGGQVTVDSYVLTIMIEYGVAGLFLFFGMLIYSVYKGGRLAVASDSRDGGLVLPLAAALLVYGTVKLVLSQEDTIPLGYVMLGAMAALIWRAKKDAEAKALAADVAHRSV